MNYQMKIKLVVARARRIQRFLSQPFTVAEQFTGMQGKYVPVKETVRGFKEILKENMIIYQNQHSYLQVLLKKL